MPESLWLSSEFMVLNLTTVVASGGARGVFFLAAFG